jgi:hypothetical protein
VSLNLKNENIFLIVKMELLNKALCF